MRRFKLLLGSAGLALAALAAAIGGQAEVGTPYILQGDFFDDTTYFGEIQLAATASDPVFGAGRAAAYSIDHGGTFEPAAVESATVAQLANETTLGEQFDPRIARLSDGGMVVAWVGYSAATGYDVFLRRYGSGAAPLDGEVRVNTYTSGEQSLPALAALEGEGGGFVVAWYSWDQDGQFGGIYAQRFGPAGEPLGDPFQVNVEPAGNQTRPAAAGLGGGGFIVVWQSEVVPGSQRYRVDARRYRADGEPIDAAPFTVNDEPSTENAWFPAVTALGSLENGRFQLNGDFAVGWTRRGDPGTGDDVWAKLYPAAYPDVPADELPLGFRVNHVTTGTQTGISLAPRDEGGFIAVWSDLVQDGDRSGIFGQVFTVEGVPLIPEKDTQINTTTAGDQTGGRIARLAEGAHLVAWTDRSAGNGKIRAQRFGTEIDLQPQGGELTVSRGSANHSAAALAGLGGNEAFAVAWGAVGDPLDPSLGGVLLQRVGPLLLTSPWIDPRRDIAVIFRLQETDGGVVAESQPRLYRYADPDSGSGGRVIYPSGYTRDASVFVGIERPPSSVGYLANDLYSRRVALAAGSCGVFWDDWVRETSGLSTEASGAEVGIADGHCHQFKWRVRNGAGLEFEYTSEDVLRADRTAPAVSVASQQAGPALAVNVTVAEQASPVTRAFSHNGSAPVPFTGDLALVPLVDGANRIRIDVTDAAGNLGQAGLYFSADLTPPRIDLYTIEDGETYGPDVRVGYTLTRPLADLRMTLDGVEVPVGDLAGLSPGAHVLVLRGTDASGNEARTQVSFNVAEGAARFSLLSPQARTYAEDRIVVGWDASEPVVSHALILDGAPRPDLVLEDLADGEHVLQLTATLSGGRSFTVTRSFTVSLASPRLAVVSPQDGAVLRAAEALVELDANGPVTYEVGGATGSIVSGQVLPLPGDGTHTIRFTVALPDGESVTRSVTVTVDALVPQLSVSSPQPRLYAFRTLPIEWAANKSLVNVSYALDGRPVTVLENLADGPHRLVLSGQDHAGRQAAATVDFRVASLEILSPLPGEKIVDNDFPPVVDLAYASGGGLTTLTASVDGGDQILLPGTSGTFPLQPGPGPHEVTVRASYNEQVLARTVAFSVGARNAQAGRHAIKYAYSACSDDLTCQVTVTLQVSNPGDYDFQDTFPVDFEVRTLDGTVRRHTWTVDGILKGEHRSVTLTPFTASFDDLFTLAVDPGRTLAGEDARDNVRQVSFQPGKILEVDAVISPETTFVEGARLDNVFSVATAGAVAFVELQAGGVYFRDGSGDQGFLSPVDMGFLSGSRNFVIVRAYDQGSRLLDTAKLYFNVASPPERWPYHAGLSPWRAFLGAGNRIFIDSVDQRELARRELKSMEETLTRSAVAFYPTGNGLDPQGRPRYGWAVATTDSAILAGVRSGPAPASARSDQLLAGAVTRMSLSSGDCLVTGVLPVMAEGLPAHMAQAAVAAVRQEVDPRIDALEASLNEALESAVDRLGLHGPLRYGFSAVAWLPLGDGFRIPIAAAWLNVTARIHLVPPKIENIRLDFTGEVERFELKIRTASCDASLAGPTVRLSSSVVAELAHLRSFSVRLDLVGGEADFVALASFGLWLFPLPVPLAFGVVGLWGSTDFTNNLHFDGRVAIRLRVVAGLRALPEPALALEEGSSAELTLAIPRSVQRLTTTRAYGLGIAWVLFVPVLGFGHVTVTTDLDAQIYGRWRGTLAESVPLANPEYLLGDWPVTKDDVAMDGILLGKAELQIHVRGFACAIFVVFPWCWPIREDPTVGLPTLCKEVAADGSVNDTDPGRCPASVTPLDPPLLPAQAGPLASRASSSSGVR